MTLIVWYTVTSSMLQRLLLAALLASLSCKPVVSQALSISDLLTCKRALYDADSNKDGRLVSREFVDLLTSITPYQNCPDTSTLEFVSSAGPYNQAFENLVCLCKDYDVPTCCNEKVLVVPSVYPEMYSYTLCMRLYALVETNCYKSPLKPNIVAAPDLNMTPPLFLPPPPQTTNQATIGGNTTFTAGGTGSVNTTTGTDTGSSTFQARGFNASAPSQLQSDAVGGNNGRERVLYIAIPVASFGAVALLSILAIYAHRHTSGQTKEKLENDGDQSGDETEASNTSRTQAPVYTTHPSDMLPPLQKSYDEEMTTANHIPANGSLNNGKRTGNSRRYESI
jgi:hypothetical protein